MPKNEKPLKLSFKVKVAPVGNLLGAGVRHNFYSEGKYHFLFMIHFEVSLKLGEQSVVLCDTADVRIDPIPSNYRASIGNKNTNTFNLERQLM